MKLPSGKITKTVAGGLDSFQGLLNELKGSNFSGYIAIGLQKDDGPSKGQIVLKEGLPALSDYEYKGEESLGKDSVNNLIRDGLSKDASLEVHGNIDVDIIIDFNADANVEAADFDLTTKAKEIEEEERKAREEAERREREAKRREELTQQINEWRSSGYIVTSLEELMEKPLNEVENAFKTFGQDIEKLMEFDKKLGSLNTKGFESEVDAIELKLNDPSAIEDLQKMIDKLQKSIESRAKKEAELRKKIDAWKNDGYNVTRLETVLETDFSAAWDAFTAFMDDLQSVLDHILGVILSHSSFGKLHKPYAQFIEENRFGGTISGQPAAGETVQRPGER